MTVVLGITGSMAMGKSTVAKMVADLVPGSVLVDADKVVHDLLGGNGAAVAAVAESFPETVRTNAENKRFIDRKLLGEAVFGHPEKLKLLESHMHHRVRASNMDTIHKARAAGAPVVVLEIPLLFETQAEVICDAVWVASAPGFIQKRRAMQRKGMTSAKFRAALKRQMPDREKRKRAHAVIPTGFGRGFTLKAIRKGLKALKVKTA